MKTVIVGGVAAGAATGARLRRLDESAEIVIFERDRLAGVPRWALPYHVGGQQQAPDDPLSQPAQTLTESLALDVRTGHEVVRVHPRVKEVEVDDPQAGRRYRESYDKLVLCPGADAIRPPVPGADHPRVDVLRSVSDMHRIIARLDGGAARAVVVGGSYVGLELVEALRSRGLTTTVVEETDRLLQWLDPEMARVLEHHVRTHGVDVRLGTSATGVRLLDPDCLLLELSDGASVEAEIVVMAVGTRPNVDLARDAGIHIGPHGGIAVDAHMCTSDPDILAAGDAVETPHLVTGEPVLSLLAGPAQRQGRIAAETVAGHDSAYRRTQGTAAVTVFDVTAGVTGMTERELRAAGMAYRKVYHHHSSQAARDPGTASLFLKILFDAADGRLLGAQVLGRDGVDKRVDVLAVALRAGMTVFDLEHLELTFAPPHGAAKDPVNVVGFLGSNLLRGEIDLWYPEQLAGCADAVTILDARTRAEYDAWHIPEAVLIPHTELRRRLDEVPRDRPVYTYCRFGFQSYLAYCVLKQNRFRDVAVLSGGLTTYHSYRAGLAGLPGSELQLGSVDPTGKQQGKRDSMTKMAEPERGSGGGIAHDEPAAHLPRAVRP